MQQVYWRRPSAGSEESTVDVCKWIHFLEMRHDRAGRPIIGLLEPPEVREGGWYRLPLRSFNESELPTATQGQYGRVSEWVRAWHGSKVEALYSILYHNTLIVGHRFKQNAPGIYVHKDDTMDKALSYVSFVQLFGDGVYWAPVWELRVDRSDRVPAAKLKTDQWIQTDRSVRLAALWLCGKTRETMEPGWTVQHCWNGDLEAHPQVPK